MQSIGEAVHVCLYDKTYAKTLDSNTPRCFITSQQQWHSARKLFAYTLDNCQPTFIHRFHIQQTQIERTSATSTVWQLTSISTFHYSFVKKAKSDITALLYCSSIEIVISFIFETSVGSDIILFCVYGWIHWTISSGIWFYNCLHTALCFVCHEIA